MTERPILMSAPMVRAILAGTKTQTRRIVKPQPTGFIGGPGVIMPNGAPAALIPMDDTVAPFGRQIVCPYGQPGDRLWVRETWQGPLFHGEHGDVDRRTIQNPKHCVYAADGGPAPEFMDADDNLQCRWRPSIHMPRWASRVTLEITGLRVERLQDISEADAKAEGVEPKWEPGCSGRLMEAFSGFSFRPAASAYADLWEQINGPEAWAANPWVWVVEFTRTK